MSPEEKKVNVNLSIKASLLQELREKGVNISALFEELVKNFLDRK